jgi:hypothetical protein
METSVTTRVASLLAAAVLTAVLSACAFPKKVKENAAAQLDLVEKLQETTKQMETVRLGALGETARLAYEAGVAEACFDLEKAVLPKDGGARTREIARRLAEAGSDKAADYRKTRARAGIDFEVLRLRLTLIHRAQETMKDYVTADIKIDDDKLEDMEKAAKALHAHDASVTDETGGGKPK